MFGGDAGTSEAEGVVPGGHIGVQRAFTGVATGDTYSCTASGVDGSQLVSFSDAASSFDTGLVGFRTNRSNARFEHIAVYGF
jgi:hypothetical protein